MVSLPPLPPLLVKFQGLVWAVVSSTSFLLVAGPVLGAWLLCEIVFYFYLRYIVLPELNRLTTPGDSVHTPWNEFHKIIDVVSQLKVSQFLSRVFFGGGGRREGKGC